MLDIQSSNCLKHWENMGEKMAETQGSILTSNTDLSQANRNWPSLEMIPVSWGLNLG